MERKKFNRGTIRGGIIRVIVAAISMVIAIIVLSFAIKNWDKESPAGGVFLCIIASAILIAGVWFIFNGVKMVLNGKKSLEVAKKGHQELGKILNLYETEVTERINTTVSHYTTYNLKFEYTNDNGELCESEEMISPKAYEKLKEMQEAPILVYGERAIFDRKKFDSEFENK